MYEERRDIDWCDLCDDVYLQVPSLLWVVVPPDTALALADTTVVLL